MTIPTIPLRIKIGDGGVQDSFATYGLIFIEADKRFAAPTKGFETESWVDEPGEHIDPRTTADAFDYKVKFLVHKRNTMVSQVVADFNTAIKTSANGIDTYKQITIYSEYKHVKIVGYPQPIATTDSYFRSGDGNITDCAETELTIRVTDPTLCDFNLAEMPELTETEPAQEPTENE